jgi:hypothetical protein
MNQLVKPVFDYEEDESFNQKVLKLVDEKMQAEKKKDVKDKLDEIRKTITHEHKPEGVKPEISFVDCPTCKGHALQVKDDTAKCTGPNCGKEYLLVPKSPIRKKYMCTKCGHTISKEEVEAVKKKDSCPLCNKGTSFLDINWAVIEDQIRDRDRLKRV